MRRGILLLSVLLLTSSLAASYTVRVGDTLYSIAQRFGTTPTELQRINGLTNQTVRVGQTLEVPEAADRSDKVIVRRAETGWNLRHAANALPGEAVTVRVEGATLEPSMRWNAESLVVMRDGSAWVGIGRELLGTSPKTVSLSVRVGEETLTSSLLLRADPRRVDNVFVGQTILSSLTQQNRAFELKILEAAYAWRTPMNWTLGFALPLAARNSSAFGGARRYYPGAPVNYHYGEDYAAASGTPVRASNDGTVSVAQRMPIRGNLIAVDHGAAVTSIYMHLSKIAVKPGQRVARGQVIGYVGSTGFSTGPHLHWEMRVRGEATNPLAWVGRRFP